jgi:mono/diheme cytochrome c family protein
MAKDSVRPKSAPENVSMNLIHSLFVARGLDPRVHLLRMKMDCRVKPGNDVGRKSSECAPVAATAMLGLFFCVAIPASAFAQDAARIASGEEAWDKAGCLQCHGSSGEGGAGGEFPAGPSLRKTRLDRAALTEAISCGLPGTQMPAWLDGAYTQRSCYDFPSGPAPSGTDLSPVLNANEIEALVDYLLAKVVGR